MQVVLAVLVAILFLPLIAGVLLLFVLHRGILNLLIWLRWVLVGKDVLFVSSDSPIWRDYMANEILPLVRDRAVILNWSQRKKWSRWSLAAHAHRAFGGEFEYNPMVVVFRPFYRAKLFRFWPAFKEWKHGKPSAVLELREQLERTLR